MAISAAHETHVAPHEGVLVRLGAGLRSRELDQALARGTPPETAPALALRARLLTGTSRRRTVADGLRSVIRHTRQGVPPSQISISPQVSAASDQLARLANALVTPGPVAARGVAQAWILLTDGTGPLYNANSTVNLRARAASAADNLHLED